MTSPKQIKVLIVEDNPRLRDILLQILHSDPRMLVVGAVDSGPAAIAMLSSKSPDTILMDVELSDMDGQETIRQIMETFPVPIVACAEGANQANAAFRVTQVGAVAIVQKPGEPTQPGFQAVADHLLQTLRLMSEVKVVRRWRRAGAPSSPSPAPAHKRPIAAISRVTHVAIGASTGGPPVLRDILASLPGNFPAPILIVQHIAPGFLDNLVEWLKPTSGPQAVIAQNGETPQPGKAYFAPDGFHTGVSDSGAIRLSTAPPEAGVRPSVSYLFRSLANSFPTSTIGVILTGMGRDGALELKLLRDRGAFAIAQDQETSIVFGMPGEAVRIGAASMVLPADKIAPALVSLVNQQPYWGQQAK